MGKVIVITSGKGGVGKTTSSSNIATGLAKLEKGKKVVVVDFDVGLRNLDALMGCERRVVYDMAHYLRGEKNVHQVCVKDKRFENLYIFPTSQVEDKDIFLKYPEGTQKLISELKEAFDYVIIDSPAGIESGAIEAMKFCDEAVVVCNPEVSSIRDSDRMIGIIQGKHSSVESKDENSEEIPIHILVTRFKPGADTLSVDDIKEVLGHDKDPIGIIPEDEGILPSSNKGVPVVVEDENFAGRAYMDTVRRIIGEDVPLVIHYKRSFWAKLLGKQ